MNLKKKSPGCQFEPKLEIQGEQPRSGCVFSLPARLSGLGRTLIDILNLSAL